MEERKDRNALFVGIGLLVLGLLFLLSNFGYYSWALWDRWWPLVLVAIGLYIIFRPAPPTESPVGPLPPVESPLSAPGEPLAPGGPAVSGRSIPTSAIILIGLGLAFWLDDYLPGNAFPALVLITIGVALLIRRGGQR